MSDGLLSSKQSAAAAGGGGVGGGVLATFIVWLIGSFVFGGGSAASTAIGAVPSPVTALVFAVVPGAVAYVVNWIVHTVPAP